MIVLTEAHLNHAQIPPKYWHALLKKISNEMPYKKDVKTYLANMDTFVQEGIGLYLWAEENSTGKTALGVITLKRAMELGYSAFYIRSDDYKEATLSKELFTENQTLVQRALDVDVLLLDDIGKEYKTKTTNYAETKIESLLRARVQAMKTTIFTGNRHPKELKDVYTNDLSELLRECMKPMNITGMNWRAVQEKKINSLFKELGN